ncbi:SA1362 family protein [Bacillaceae bacterium S4-13-58]
MRKHIFPTIFYLIIGFAVFGFLYRLIKEPGQLFMSLLVIIGIMVVFYAIYHFFLSGRTGSKDMQRYKQAVKQSKKKYKPSSSPIQKTTSLKGGLSKPNKKKARTNSHLTVIDGAKNKKKNRATN